MQISSTLWILGLLLVNNALLILQLCDACCERPEKKLDKRWEALREPLLRKKALEITQKQMLNVLGLNELPRPNRRVIRPHAFMLDLYKTLSRGAKRKTTKVEAQEMINTVRGVVDQGQSSGYTRVLPCYHTVYVSVVIMDFFSSVGVFCLYL
jgi:hypothetical protein